jgi:hypothetical protein
VLRSIPKKFTDAQATPVTLTAAQSGEAFRCVVDCVVTLPAAAAATRGVWYKIINGVASAGAGLLISPNAADGIGGLGLTTVVNKDLSNTPATDVLGDYVIIECTGIPGTGAWVIRDAVGIWSKEA